MSLKMAAQSAREVEGRARRIRDMVQGTTVCTEEYLKAEMFNLEIEVRTLRHLVDGLYMEERE